METFPDFATYLEGVQNQNQQIRQNSEAQIRQCKQQDPTKFACSLIKELCDEANSQNARTMAAVVFKNTLINSNQEEGGNNLWFNISEELRGFIKQALLQQLGNENKETLKSASIGLGIIAAIEVPEGQWDQFLQLMADNSTQEHYQFRLASIQSLGFLMEFLDQYIDKELQQEQVGQVLHATICNINAQSVELTQIAIKALQRTISATAENFQIKEQRDFIMEGLFRAIEIPDEQVQCDALEAIGELPRVAYAHISEYIPKIGEITIKLINEPEATKQARMVMNFWQHLCQTEREFAAKNESRCIFSQFKDALLPIIFQGLCIIELDNDEDQVEDSQDDIEWSVSRASACLLVEVAALLGDQILQAAIQFASEKLNGQSWQEIYIGMVALGAVMEGPSSEAIQRELDPAYSSIFNMLSNSSSRVRAATVWLICQICKNAPMLVFQSQANLQLLMEKGLSHIENDHIQVRQFVALAWMHLWENANLMGNHIKALLNPYFAKSIEALLNIFFSMEAFKANAIVTLSNSVNQIFESCDSESLKAELFNSCQQIYTQINTLKQQLMQDQSLDIDQKEVILNSWCSCLQPCIVRMGQEGVNDQMIEAFVTLAVDVFNQIGKVTNGGLFVLNGLTATIDSRISIHVPKFMDFLLCGMKMENCDQMGTRLSAGMISDISNAIGTDILPWLQQINSLLRTILEDQSFDSEAKLIAIIAFGDVALAAGPQNFVAYLEETQSSFQAAAQMSLSVGSNSEEIQLLSRLRVALVEAYLSILHGLEPETEIDGQQQLVSAQDEVQIEQFALQMFQYLEALVAQKEISFPTELLKSVYELYLDLATMYVSKQQVRNGRGNQHMGDQSVLLKLTESSLNSELRSGLRALPDDEDRLDIEQRFQQLEKQIQQVVGQMAPQAPCYGVGMAC